MYDVIVDVIGHSWSSSYSEEQIVYYICGALLCMVSCAVIDLVYRIFAHFWH